MDLAKEAIGLMAAILVLSAAIIPIVRRKEIKAKATVKIEYQITTYPNFIPLYCIIVTVFVIVGFVLFCFGLETAGLGVVFFGLFYFGMAFPVRKYPPTRQEIYTAINTLLLLFLMLLMRSPKQP